MALLPYAEINWINEYAHYEGDTWSKTLRARELLAPGVYGDPIDFTDYSFLAQCRPDEGSNQILFTYHIDPDPDQLTNPGIITVSLIAGQTSGKATGSTVVWDWEFTTPEAEVYTYAKGLVFIIPQVSRV